MKQRKQHMKQILKVTEKNYVNIDSIDVIDKTYIDPDTHENLTKPIYVIYLKNSHYNKIKMSVESFKKYIENFL